MNTQKDTNEAYLILRQMYGYNAEFREGQLEAILNILEFKRLLIVQRTGWGKSIIYFIVAKILRNRRQGVTLLISPLLSLIRNQISTAESLGVVIRSINSSNPDSHSQIMQELKNDEVDLLMIAPEQIANHERFERITKSVSNIGMLVVDEAHCISDWGHDFRPDYQRILDIVSLLPKTTLIIATTATANDRVIDDISEQLGDLKISRGQLKRESLIIEPIKLTHRSERLAWILENIKKIDGSGIIYCLTIRDTFIVADFLRKNGISAYEYHADLESDFRLDLEDKFYTNRIKCLVATIALGMGYDKPDVSFVIHFQRPKDIVSYYQQIGRAGRNLDIAYAILFNGDEDEDIMNYFINNAFPTEKEMQEVLFHIMKSDEGIDDRDLKSKVNLSSNKIENTLKYLSVKNIIRKENKLNYRTLRPFNIDFDKNEQLTKRRIIDFKKIEELFEIETCYMSYVANELDDDDSSVCGKCQNCTGNPSFSHDVNSSLLVRAQEYLSELIIEILPRKQFPYRIDDRIAIPPQYIVKKGYALCYYNDPGLGTLVKEGKYTVGLFDKELSEKLAKLIRDKVGIDSNTVITYVPSWNHPELVKNLAHDVSKILKLPCLDVVEKTFDSPLQKSLLNSNLQAKNALDSFRINTIISKPKVILIDDITNSRWTFTICGLKLIQKGAKEVYPFSLAVTR